MSPVKIKHGCLSNPGRAFRPPESSGKIAVPGRKSMENGSGTPCRKIAELSGDSSRFHREKQEFDRKAPEKSENFPDRNTASMKVSEPAVTLPNCPTWVVCDRT
jgi:hypothetical protein